MTQSDFLRQFGIIRDHLLNLASDFRDRKRFLKLLDHLQSKKLLSKEILNDLYFLWQTRNRVINSTAGNQEITEGVFGRLQQIKSKLPL